MRKDTKLDDEEEPLVDTTAALTKNSKRLDRKRRKVARKKANQVEPRKLLDLPYEMVMGIFFQLRPSDLFNLRRTSRDLNIFILNEENILSKEIITRRYQALAKCFPIPTPIENVESNMHSLLLKRQDMLGIHWKPYQHIKPFDPHVICTCITCVLRWNNLNIIADFAHYQRCLDQGEPIPKIDRGMNPSWNQELLERNAGIVEKSLRSRLWYAWILEGHLKSTVRSINRHANNKGNKRRRFRMSIEDAASETDVFLERSGPPMIDAPFHRDNYYMLEAFLPNRSWSTEEQRWKYVPESHHLRDLEWVKEHERRVLDKAQREEE